MTLLIGLLIFLFPMLPLATTLQQAKEPGVQTERPADWKYQMSNEIEDRFYIDLNSIEQEGNRVRFREKTVYGPHLRISMSSMMGRPVFYDIGVTEIDCKAKTFQRGLMKPKPIIETHPMHATYLLVCTSGKKAYAKASGSKTTFYEDFFSSLTHIKPSLKKISPPPDKKPSSFKPSP